MGLEKIIAIANRPGLYQYKAQTNTGFIAQSIESGKNIPVNLRHDVSMLSEIAIYTEDGEMPLGEVFEKIYEKENGGKAISHKTSKDELLSYFGEVLPNYDHSRVYNSHVKKVLQWYNLLIDHGFTSFKKEEEVSSEEE